MPSTDVGTVGFRWWPLAELSGLPKHALIQQWNPLHSLSPSHTQDFPSFCKHLFANPLHIQRHLLLFWHPFSLSEATFLKQLLTGPAIPYKWLELWLCQSSVWASWRHWKASPCPVFALLSFSEVKESCSLCCPKDVFHHCEVWGNGGTWANAAVDVLLLGLWFWLLSLRCSTALCHSAA